MNKRKTYWIKTASTGEPSASLTLVMVTYAVIMLWLVLSIFTNPFGLTIMPFNASEAMLVLSPILMLYFGRRHTEKNTVNNSQPSQATGESD